MANETYNNQKVFLKQGADEQVIASGGKITVESGGAIDVDDAFIFYAGSLTASGENLKALLRVTQQFTWTNLSTGSTVLSAAGGSAAPVMPSDYGIIHFSVTNTMTNGSCRLHSGITGQKLMLRFTNAAGNNASLQFHASGNDGLAGVKLFGSNGIELSSIAIRQSATSWGWVELLCVKDGTWAVVNADADNVTEMLGA
jgi:hypothetical protein